MKTFHRAGFALFAALLLCAASPFFAQDAAGGGEASAADGSWYYGKIIKSVTFKGLKSVSAKDVDGVTSGFIGKQFTDELFYSMIDRIYALELFDDIEPEAIPGDSKRNTVAIIFTVKERPIVSRLVFSGNRQIRTNELKETVNIKEKDVFVSDKVLLAERALRDKYLEKGFTNIRVSSSTKETEKGIEVTFLIDEGRSTVVASIDFSGNKVYPAKKLRRCVNMKETKLFRKGAFQESMIEADKMAVEAFYRDGGYVDAHVLDVTRDITINEKKNREELTITFYIEEGEQYTYTGITFTGNEIYSDEKLASLIKLKEGAAYSETKLYQGLSAITDLYGSNGYMSNRYTPIPNQDSELKTISFVLSIVENPRSHVESIVIKGNTKTKEKVIRREIPIETGDIFTQDKLATGMRNLYNLQYFNAIVPDFLQGSDENLVDLVFTVEEHSTISMEVGVTFSGVTNSGDLPFAVNGRLTDSNIRGTGRSASVSTTLSSDQQSVGLSLDQNWLFDKPISSSVYVDFSHSKENALRFRTDPSGSIITDDYYMDYDKWSVSSGVSFGRRWTPDWAILRARTGVDSTIKKHVYDEDMWLPVDSTVSDYANKWGWQNDAWVSFSIDDRDINYDPSTGWFASQKFTWFGLTPFESEYFLRTDTKFEKYFMLFNKKITESWSFKAVLMFYSVLSLEFPVPGTAIGTSSKLYIDGMFDGRGWTSIYSTNRGKAKWSNTVELRIPIVPGVLAADWFGDAACIKGEPYEIFNGVYQEDFFFSTGPGIRFTIQQFPLRLLFANTFKVSNYTVKWDKKWKFVLSFNVINQ